VEGPFSSQCKEGRQGTALEDFGCEGWCQGSLAQAERAELAVPQNYSILALCFSCQNILGALSFMEMAGSARSVRDKLNVARSRLGVQVPSVPDLLAFEPSTARALALDQRIRDGLAQSLEKICAALEDLTVVPSPAVDRLLIRIRSTQVRPAIFALYTKLVAAIELDDIKMIERLVAELGDPLLLEPAEHRIVTLSSESLGSDLAVRYCDIIDDDSAVPLHLSAVTEQQLRDGAASVSRALELLAAADSEFVGEVTTLGNEIVLATPPLGSPPFGGVTTFYLWGSMFINPITPSRMAMLEALVHEAAHLLLFGMTMGGAMVENSDAERYASPLRSDARPMDGIVHATYVLARLAYCAECLLRSNSLTVAERNEVMRAREINIRLFRDGLQTVRQHARFTEIGRLAFERCVEACSAPVD
jgi:hypothetical protein